MNVEQKQQAVAELTEGFKASCAAYVVDYKGCSCEELKSLRKKLLASGSRMSVVKNTLARRALDGKDGALDFFVGPTAIVWADTDPVAPAKVISDFAKESNHFSIKGGLVDGDVVSESGVSQLAALPSREELYAKLLSLINAPATRLLQTINAPATDLVRLLGAWRDKLEKGE